MPRPAAVIRSLLAGVALGLAIGSHAQVPAAAPTAPVALPDREIAVASDAFTKDPTQPAWVRPHAVPESRTAGASVLALADTQILVGAQTTTYVHRAIKVNDATVLSNIGNLRIAFIPAYQKLVLHTLQVRRDGVVLDRLPDAPVRFLQRETGLDHNLYSGIVTASTLVDDVRVGDTLDVAYSTIGVNPVFGPVFSGAEPWDQGVPVDERRLILDVPIDRRVAWKTHGELTPAIATPTERVVGGRRAITFEGSSLAALASEPGVPAGVSVGRWIEFSEYPDWNAVASWAAALFVDDQPPSPDRIALVATMMVKPTVEERVVAALEFVQSQVRYFSVSLGTSSHRPAAPNAVLQRRYGDCKDKSLLLVALLRDMGIAATPALARLGNRTGFDDRLPTPLAFDHVIVRVEVDGIAYDLDATRMGQHGKLARMGQVHDGSQILLASPATRGPVRVDVADRDALALDDRVEQLTMKRLDGDAELRVTTIQNGVLAEALRAIRGALTQERIDAIVTTDVQKRYPGARLLEPVRIDDDPVENRITMRYGFALQKPAKRNETTWQIPLRAENLMSIFTLPPDAKRLAPVVVRYPVNAHYRFDATFPDEVMVNAEPVSRAVDDPVFVGRSDFAFRGNRATVTAEIRTRADRVAATGLPRLREDLQKFQGALPNSVVVRDADLRKTGLFGIGQQDLAASLRARQEEIVRRISGTLEAGQLTGGDLALAHCGRAAAYLTLERNAEAEQDADRAVAVDPTAPEMLFCRGTVRVGTGRYAAAIDDLTQALVMGSRSERAYMQRGVAKFQLGRYAEAADDFAKAHAIDPDERSKLNLDVWCALALRRLSQPLPDELAQRAALDPRGDWPRPALALFADRLGVDEVARLAARSPGDAGQMEQTEADFFIGEHYLALGDLAKARDAFAAARARGVITYIEYGAAGAELARLGPR